MVGAAAGPAAVPLPLGGHVFVLASVQSGLAVGARTW